MTRILPAGPARPASPGAGPRRASALAAAAAVVFGLVLTGCGPPDPEAADGVQSTTAAQTGPESSTPASPAPEPVTEAEPVALSEGVAPARLQVPTIKVDEQLIDLGLQADGAMEVPSDWDRAGWFTGGGKPGGAGPTVIAGHVDSRTGPAVFFRLTELQAGDLIEVTDVEGTVHDYEVYGVKDVPKDRFPTAEVFGALATDELRLITCTGEFDEASLRHSDNRVVFAAPVDASGG